MISLIRYLIAARRRRRAVRAAIDVRRDEIVEHEGLRISIGAIGDALLAHARDDLAARVLADAAALPRAVRYLAARGPIAGLEVTCPRCGRQTAALVLHREGDGFRETTEGRCPQGHALPALPAQTTFT